MDLATIQIKVDTRQVKAANEDIQQLGKTGQMTSKKVTAANDDMATSAKSTTSAFKLLGGAMAALGVGALVSSFARTVTESERLKGSLKTMTGSTEDAAFAFSELERFAAQTPFTLDQSVEGFIKLKALGLDPSERALRSYGNTSAAMGKDMMQMIEAVADASTGEFERLKEFGIKASKQGDQVSLTFQGLTTTIGNSSEEIQNYLLEIGETKFGTAMEDQMKALPGLLSNLSDNVGALFRKIGDVGGIDLFAGAITAASAVVLGITNNIEILTVGVGAALAGFLAFTIGSNATRILNGFKAMQVSVLALNTAILANPIGLIAAAIGAAAVLIVSYWDEIKEAAEKAGLMAEIAFEKLKLFLMENFSTVFKAITDSFNFIVTVVTTVGEAISDTLKAAFGFVKDTILATVTSIELKWMTLKLFFETTFSAAISGLGDMFTGLQNTAIATMAAVSAAAKDPFNAITTFNSTFDATLTKLESGSTKSNTFATSIGETKGRIAELESELETMNTEVSTSETGFDTAGRSLSDYAIEVDKSAVAANELAAETEAARVKTLELLGEISNETEALNMSNVEIAIRNNLQKAGVDATSELGEQIVEATTQLYAEKDAIESASAAAKQLEKDNDAAQKAIEKETKRVAEEAAKAYEEMKNNISGFFMDLFENGRDAFDNLAKTFKNMILQMIADWAASKIAGMISGTFSGLGTSISSMFSGIFSSIGGSIASLASSAASILTGGAIGGGGAAAAGGGVVAGGGGVVAGGGTAGAGAMIGGALGSAGSFIGGLFGQGAGIAAGTMGPPTAAAAAGANLGAMLFNPVTAAIAAIALGFALDSGGTPTSSAGITMAVTPGMNKNGQNTFAIEGFESGFAPIGFKQNATDAQAAAAIKPIRDLDAIMTEITKSAGYDVNLKGHTFSGLGVEGSGSGTLLGTFIEEGKTKGVSIEKQMDTYAAEWVKAVGSRNGLSSDVISQIVGNGTAEGILQAMGEVLTEHRANTFKSEMERINNEQSSAGSTITETANQAAETIFNAADVSTLTVTKAAKDAAKQTKLTLSSTDTSAATVNANNMGPLADTAIASSMGPQQQTIGKTGLTEEELRNLSDTQVGNLIAAGKFSAFQAANFYQDRYPGLTVNDVKASMAAMGLTIPSHRDGLNMVPYDGYVAELHAGERVQTAEQARASDTVADEMSGLRQSIEDVMIAVARNTSKLYRLNDRWDKNGLPPVRA